MDALMELRYRQFRTWTFPQDSAIVIYEMGANAYEHEGWPLKEEMVRAWIESGYLVEFVQLDSAWE